MPLSRREALRALFSAGASLAAAGLPGRGAEVGEPAGGALAGERPRVIVSTDIGGSDPDDYQSLVHYLVYADVLATEGLISSPPGAGRTRHILEVIDAYEKDYPHLRGHDSHYPTPDELRRMTRQGALLKSPRKGVASPTDGSRWIIERARADDPRPLYVLVWGALTDVAQAVHDEPAIKKKLHVHSIGSWNTRQDPHARDYLFQGHPDLWWIENDTTFRGMYLGGSQQDDLDNRVFVARHVRGHGALGELFVRKKADIKMGDTPSLLYLLRGDPERPETDHWGGRFAAIQDRKRPHSWTDSQESAWREGGRPGARTVSRWRASYLRDWQRRMDRCLGGKGA